MSEAEFRSILDMIETLKHELQVTRQEVTELREELKEIKPRKLFQ